MKVRVTFLLIAIIILCMQRVGAVPYTVTEIGVPDPCVLATGINNGGQVVGQMGITNGAYIWSEISGLQALDPLGGGLASAINSAGVVVGEDERHAFVWDGDGGMRDIHTLPSTYYSGAHAINDAKQVAGWVGPWGFVWTEEGGMATLGMLPGMLGARARAINDSGIIAGNANAIVEQRMITYAVMWDEAGEMYDLRTLRPGDDVSYARGINDLGQIVGESGSSQAAEGTYDTHAFLWSAAFGMVDLGALPGRNRSWANDINNLGQVVGSSGDHAFIWDQVGGMRPLENLPGTTSSQAYAINDLGWIVGISQGADSLRHAVLWKPVPEPSGLLALGGGLLAVGLPWLRSRPRTKA